MSKIIKDSVINNVVRDEIKTRYADAKHRIEESNARLRSLNLPTLGEHKAFFALLEYVDKLLQDCERVKELERTDELLAREYPVELRKLPDDDCWIAWHPDFGWSTCSAVEDTPQAALELLNKVRIDVIQHFIDTGKEIPEPSKKGTNETPHPVPPSKNW